MRGDSDPGQGAPPFGLSAAQPVFDRATRLATALFGATGSTVVLVEDGRAWRSNDPGGLATRDPAADQVMATGQPIWIEDLTLDPRFEDDPGVTGLRRLRFYAAAPVLLSDGSTPGVLCVVGREPRAYHQGLASCLQDLADSVADECDRARLAEAAAKSSTALVRAMDLLDRSEQRLDIVLQMSAIHVYEVDYVNRTIETAGAPNQLYGPGLTFDDVAGSDLAFIDPRDRAAAQKAYETHMRGEAPCAAYEFRVNRPDGREIWVSAVAQLTLDDEGRILRALGAMQDITGRKTDAQALIEAKEAAEGASRAKSTFLATMSHEIRTPMNGVLGMAQAMAADELSPVQRERLEVVRQSGETLLVILNEILDLSTIEAGKLELEAVDLDLCALAKGAEATFRVLAEEKGLDFSLEISPQAAGVYRGDPTRVRQILANLVSNALKFTTAGSVAVRLTRDEMGLTLSVADSGIGIAPDQLERLFEKFEQVDASTTRKFGGTGLGLSICRELVRLMGGDITATSEPGRGTTFTVRLPLPWLGASAPAAPAEAAAGPREAALAAPEAALKVLAAEDNTINQLVLKTLLAQVGLEATIVADGAEAVDRFAAEPWDVILMDVQMPVLDGVSAARRIRALEAERGVAPTPIIALTANAMSHHIAEYLAAGMNGFVPKPIDAGRLYAALETALAEEPDVRVA
jgi:PAS domain S-box-containing protein